MTMTMQEEQDRAYLHKRCQLALQSGAIAVWLEGTEVLIRSGDTAEMLMSRWSALKQNKKDAEGGSI